MTINQKHHGNGISLHSLLKTLFTGGKTDSCIAAIRFTPDHGYYWDNKNGNTIAGVKMMIGAAIGKTLDDSIESTLQP